MRQPRCEAVRVRGTAVRRPAPGEVQVEKDREDEKEGDGTRDGAEDECQVGGASPDQQGRISLAFWREG
jgi:hypothetical protein